MGKVTTITESIYGRWDIFDTIEDAQNEAYRRAENSDMNHAYVFAVKEGFGGIAHAEDRYLSSYIPSSARIIMASHRRGIGLEWGNWEQREQHTTEEFDLISGVLGESVASFLLTDDEEN